MKVAVSLVITFLLIFTSGYFFTLPGAVSDVLPDLISREVFALDTLTIYNPSSKQCDGDPLVTASNRRINLAELQTGTIRWMALSRDMLKRWGGQLHYGDTVELHAGDKSIDGIWIIQDTMNRRFKKRGDLLFDSRLRSKGMWTGVTITKRRSYAVTLDS
jgi:hypothetical protein